MHTVLAHLEPLNVNCRIRLTKLLSDLHGVQLWPDDASPKASRGRGGTIFLAFDPWQTCLRLPPGSFRYFYAAEKAKILSDQDALRLSRILLDRCLQASACYDGYFSEYFRQNHIKIYLEHAQDLDYLLKTGLALGSACADTLFETCPWPVVPERHLVAKAFSQARIDREIYHYLQDPWSTWMEALEVTCLGPWLGLKPDQVSAIMEKLQPCPNNRSSDQSGVARHSAHKVSIPFFANGFQGIVVGFFSEIPDDEKEAIFATLWQFGQTMSDAYSSYRGQQFLDVIRTECDAEALARAIINLAGPLNTIIVELGSNQTGYQLKYENEYWAGYRPLNSFEIGALRGHCRKINIHNLFRTGVSLFIEPLTNITFFDAELSLRRIENCVAQFVNIICKTMATTALNIEQCKLLLEELDQYVSDKNVSIAKWRKYYVVEKVIKNWPQGRVNIANSELKTFLESKVGHPLKNGYQISSYIKEIENTFEQKIKISKTRTGVMLTWSQNQ